MKILFVSVEMSPIAKVGGLADVIGSLPKALRALGHDARVILPYYGMIQDNPNLKIAMTLEGLNVEMNPDWRREASFHETEIDGVPVGFIGYDEYFAASKSSESLYQPGGLQHLFFSSAVLKAMEELDWIPDVIHCHDWHTGFLPVLMREKRSEVWNDTSAIYTIHNLAYQGEFGIEVLDALDLPRSLYNATQLETWGRVNFLKAGCVFSDRVNTVSRTYVKEIQTPEYGATLDGLMRHLAASGRLSGILNGIDTDFFNPSTDPALPVRFSAGDPKGKAECRKQLRAELGLANSKAPLLGVVSRLSSQKGLDLIIEAANALVGMPAQLVVQGLGDPAIAEALKKLEAKHPKQIRLVQKFDADLAQRIYAGCDGFLMPSKFEPCGLGQLIAMRYGTVPLVRATGGLADTVEDGKTGFAFTKPCSLEFINAAQRLSEAFHDADRWQTLIDNVMSQDFGWDRSAREYVALYQSCQEEEWLRPRSLWSALQSQSFAPSPEANSGDVSPVFNSGSKRGNMGEEGASNRVAKTSKENWSLWLRLLANIPELGPIL